MTQDALNTNHAAASVKGFKRPTLADVGPLPVDFPASSTAPNEAIAYVQAATSLAEPIAPPEARELADLLHANDLSQAMMQKEIALDARVQASKAAWREELQKGTSAGETAQNADALREGGVSPSHIRRHLLTQGALKNLSLPERNRIVGDFAQEGGIGYLFAPRGEGKTWLGLHLSKCIASGAAFGPYPVSAPRKVLYIDGEMNVKSLQERIDKLPNDNPDNFQMLSSEIMWLSMDGTYRGLNLNSPHSQKALAAVLREDGFKVVVLDNLSCLFSGLKENESDSWEGIMPFLAELKHSGVLVIILHHTNKSGEAMRGTSRREDQADFIIRIRAHREGANEKGVLRLKTEFTKSRNCQSSDLHDEIVWSFRMGEAGQKAVVEYAHYGKECQVLQLIKAGITRCEEIAEELSLAKSTVSMAAQELQRQGLITVKNRRYVLKEEPPGALCA